MTVVAREESATTLLIRAQEAYDGVAGDPRRYAPLAADLVAEARRAADQEALVVALRAVAWAARARRHNGQALRLLDEAIRLARRAGMSQRLTELLVTRAATVLELGRVAAAVRDLDRAAIGGGRPAPEIEFMRAVLLHNLGRLEPAATAYRRVLADPSASLDNQGSAANNLALVAAAQGRFDESLRYLTRADQLAATVGPSLYAFAAHNRGLVLAQSGRLAEGLAELDRSTQLFAQTDVPLGEYYMEHADVLTELRLLPEARELARRAVAELDAQGVLLLAAEARLTLAQTVMLTGDARAARAAATEAEALFRRQRRTAWAARASVLVAQAALADGTADVDLLRRASRAAGVLDRSGMPSVAAAAHLTAGELAERLGRPSIAQRCFGAAHDRSRQGPVLVRVRGRLAAARAERLAGRDDAVLRHCRAGLADLARHRAALGSTELRALASGHGVQLGRLGFETLLRTGSALRVLGWMERTRAAALLTVEPPAPDDLQDEFTELRLVQAELAEARRGTGEEPVELRTQQAAVEARIRRSMWRRAGPGGDPAPCCSPGELRRRLDGRALASFATVDGELVAVVMHGPRSSLVGLGPADAVRSECDSLLFALRRLTRPGRAATAAAARAGAEYGLRRLTDLLLRPLDLPADAPLVVVPDARTYRVPWSALHAGPVCVAPSAALWARTRVSEPGGAGHVVLVAGPRLPGAVAEVAAVRALYDRPTVLAAEAATVAATTEALAGAGLAHLACHGRLRSDNPTFSALELADGLLTVHELDRRSIAPARVVLAACDSAADVTYAGDELLGFVSALLARGTAGIVASMIAVGDLESVGLMAQLHHGLLAGRSMAEALHAARATLDPADPLQCVNWCAFAAYGGG
ncbi:CHAT domain-containing protein [Geodermatophilus sp. YIM 151500]|uniref:CHAT domain-containing protein n=1 Tax=Geodermatophilus sp. YIM 151500 TaxID=2984531 RepID=UPI0021E36248|nr:CHAT domain-containing protein [Geodermatophilus sp. YIM 151500]MCV2489841.1 CHAT domain-containing protein [Geodermatophilus sp. YIM 151500]